MVACCRLFNSERAVLFLYDSKKDEMPKLYATHNISREEIDDKAFRKNLNLVMKSFRKKEILIDKKPAEDVRSGGNPSFRTALPAVHGF